MKTRLFVSAAIALFSVAVYPSMELLANAERGYTGRIDNVFGGEEMLLIFGLFISLMIIVEGVDKLLWEKTDKKRSSSPKATASQTESEESESNSL